LNKILFLELSSILVRFLGSFSWLQQGQLDLPACCLFQASLHFVQKTAI